MVQPSTARNHAPSGVVEKCKIFELCISGVFVLLNVVILPNDDDAPLLNLVVIVIDVVAIRVLLVVRTVLVRANGGLRHTSFSVSALWTKGPAAEWATT